MTAYKETYREKRAFPRFPINDDSLAMLSPGDIISFRVLDISMSGMAFCYNGDLNGHREGKKSVLTFLADTVGSLELPVEIVSDVELSDEMNRDLFNRQINEKPYLRRCGLRFMAVDQDGQAALEEYVQTL